MLVKPREGWFWSPLLGRESAFRGPEIAYRGYKNVCKGREYAGPGHGNWKCLHEKCFEKAVRVLVKAV